MSRDANASVLIERHENSTRQPAHDPGGGPDPRVTATVDHDLPDILTIALCTILCGGDSFYDMEDSGQVRLGLAENIFAPAPRCAQARHLQPRLPSPRPGTVRRLSGALDGKTLRRALNKGEDARVIVSAWATESGLLLGQRKVRDKSNEITAVPELLRALELAGCIVTADALHCQKNIAKEIKEADAEYVLALKKAIRAPPSPR